MQFDRQNNFTKSIGENFLRNSYTVNTIRHCESCWYFLTSILLAIAWLQASAWLQYRLRACLQPQVVYWLLQVSVYNIDIFCYTLLHLQPLVSYRLVWLQVSLWLPASAWLQAISSTVSGYLQPTGCCMATGFLYCLTTGYCIYSL